MIRFLRNFFFRDWLLKLFSLTLAILTWLAVSFSLRQRGVPVPEPANLRDKPFLGLPVTIVSRDADVSGYKAEPPKLDVTFRGNERLLDELDSDDLHVFVDLSGMVLKAPQKRPVEVMAPPGISYVHVMPDSFVQIIPPPKTNQPARTP